MDAASLAQSLIGARQAATGQAAAMSMLKKSADADQAMAGLLDQAVESAKAMVAAPPPGTGTRVDITA